MADVGNRYGPTLLTASPVTLFTVPAATIFTVRNIHVSNNSGADARFTVSVGSDATGTRIYQSVLLEGDGGAFDWSGFMPLQAGEIMEAFADTPSVLTITISGVDTT